MSAERQGTDEFAVLEAAFSSGDRGRLRLALARADSPEVQQALLPRDRAEFGALISEGHKRLFMDGRA